MVSLREEIIRRKFLCQTGLEGKVVENIHWTESLFSLKIEADVCTFQGGAVF